jgi:GMP synthase-like glutamine amidotransferase
MKFLVFQHLATEHPGTFGDLMREADIPFDVVALDEGAPIPDLSPYAALLAFGGPANVWQEQQYPWLIAEKAAIRQFVAELRRPFLGVCLGHQLLAEAFGGMVGPMQRAEAGLSQLQLTEAGRGDALFGGLGEPLVAMQWHGAEVKALPDRAVTLAGNEACPIQAFRLHERAYGLQFHVEVKAASIARWESLPAYRRAVEENNAKDLQRDFTHDAARHLRSFRDTAAALFGRFRKLAA